MCTRTTELKTENGFKPIYVECGWITKEEMNLYNTIYTTHTTVMSHDRCGMLLYATQFFCGAKSKGHENNLIGIVAK